MNNRLLKGSIPFITVVFLLLVLLVSCTHTQQETDAALMYSPTLDELEMSPLSVIDDVTGYGRIYETWGVEDFSTLKRGPALGFILGVGGVFPTAADDYWIIGQSDGHEKYISYYETDSNLIPLRAKGHYELRFNYKVLETPDEGFEVIFLSDTAVAKNDWLDKSIFLNSPVGSEGEAVLDVTLKDYRDYRVIMNVISKGKIAVSNIRIKDMDSNTIVAKEDTMTVKAVHSPFIRFDGNVYIGNSSIPGASHSAYINSYSNIRTVPAMVQIPADSIVVVEFDYNLIANKSKLEFIGYVRLFTESDPTNDRGGINIPGYNTSGGHFTAGFKSGSKDVPYVVEIGIMDVNIEITNLKFSVQKAVPRKIEEHPVQHLVEAPYPRLGDYQTAMFEWVAHDGSGTAQGTEPLIAIEELERLLAYNDIIVGMHQNFSTNDPAAAVRLRTLNPHILLLPVVPTYHVGLDDNMIEQFSNPLASAEILFIKDLDENWYLRDAKGSVLNEQDGYSQILLNISPFCPTDSQGQTYTDYWPAAIHDIHVKDGTWDGLSLQHLLSRAHYEIPGVYRSSKVNADYNLNGKKDEPLAWTNEMTASSVLTMLRRLRQQIGFDQLVLSSPEFDRSSASLVNGAVISTFNLPWYLENDPSRFSEGQWCGNLQSYYELIKQYRKPAVVVLQAIPCHPDWIFPENKRQPDEKDTSFQRIAMGTALLTDAFFDYDLVDSRSAPYFFDEMMVDASGKRVVGQEGKGYLGQPLNSAHELVTNREEVLVKTEPLLIGDKRSKTKTLYRGRQTTDSDKQFIVEFDWEVLETLVAPSVINVIVGSTWQDYFNIPGLLSGEAGHVRLHTTIEPKKEVNYKLTVGKQGVLEIKNLQVYTADAGVYRRDFEYGLVLVNATTEEKEISYADIAGELGRTNIRRIKGVLDPQTNTGKPVKDALTLAAHDAIVLLAD